MRKTILSILIAVGVVAAGIAQAADPPAAPAAGTEIVYGAKVGDLMKPSKLTGLDGGKGLDTAQLSSKTILMLVSSVCTACRTELQEITANIKEFDGKAALYAVIIDMDPAPGAERIKQSIGGAAIGILGDSEYAIGRNVNMVSAPSTLILDKDGKILYKGYGYNPGQWKEYARLLR